MNESFECSRPAQEAFDYIVDFSRIHEWDHTIVSAEKVTAGAVSLGTKFDLLYKMGPRELAIEYEIIEFQPNQRAVLKGVSAAFTAIDTVTISETKKGCQVTWNADLEFMGRAAKIVPLIKKRVVSAGLKTIHDLSVALQDDFDVPSLRPIDKLADLLILPGVLGFSALGLQSRSKHFEPVTASMRDKHVVITGATSGLGLATAKELAHRGAELTLVARDSNKVEQLVKQLIETTGNQLINFEIADLVEPSEVADLGRRLIKSAKPIDVLINNAGALFNQRLENSEGQEASFALLLLAPYLLTEQLHPLLAKAGAARVINVSSGGMYAARLQPQDLQSKQGDYQGAQVYARAKRGLVVMGERWATRWKEQGITVHNMHPGWARTPGVEQALPGFTRVTNRILRTPEQGADTIIWLANATEAAKTSGLFWFDRRPHSTNLSIVTRTSKRDADTLEESLKQLASKYLAG